MNLKEAKRMIDNADDSEWVECEYCVYNINDNCTTDKTCSEAVVEAARVIVREKDAKISELEKKYDEARKDAKSMAVAANIMMQLLENRDYPESIVIMEKYK